MSDKKEDILNDTNNHFTTGDSLKHSSFVKQGVDTVFLALNNENLPMEFSNIFQDEIKSCLQILKEKSTLTGKFYAVLKQIKNLGLSKNVLVEKASAFTCANLKGRLLTAFLPLEDRKLLADVSDFLLSQFSLGVVVLLGEATMENKSSAVSSLSKENTNSSLETLKKYPILVNVSKQLSHVVSAGSMLKNTIIPVCKGRGGGRAGFAQGSIYDKDAFYNLRPILLKKLQN